MNQNERQLFQFALQRWGWKNQSDQADEELHELALELHRIRRNRHKNLEALAEEVADVSIMIDQIKVNFGKDFESRVAHYRGAKIARLTGRILDSKHIGD